MIEYKDVPTYFLHLEDETGKAADPLEVTFDSAKKTMTVNGQVYYNSAKVDELINSVKTWANGQFQPKAN